MNEVNREEMREGFGKHIFTVCAFGDEKKRRDRTLIVAVRG
jgi:hypothetical protein